MARRSLAASIPDNLEPEKVPTGFEKTPEPQAALDVPPPREEKPAPPAVPDPDDVAPGEGDLTAQELENLTACETALDVFRLAFVEAGKALEVISKGKLYRGNDYTTFDEYVEQRWQMSPAQAYRWISEWHLAVALSPIGEKNVNESHVRELLPITKRFPEDERKAARDAVVTVYATLVKEARERRVTATLIKGAVAALPAGPWNDDAAGEAVRAYLASLDAPASEPETGAPVDVWESLRASVRRTVHRTVSTPAFQKAARTDPARARTVVTELQTELKREFEALLAELPDESSTDAVT